LKIEKATRAEPFSIFNFQFSISPRRLPDICIEITVATMPNKILIVDNNPLIAEAIEQAGERFLMKADRASDGWEAIEMLETEQYAAIVINSDLPRHSGFGVLDYLRQEIGDDLENVIVMTTANRDDVQRKLGQHGVLVVAVDDVAAEVERSLEARRP
jgi:CheY-like chemotaxis protein